MRDKNEYSAEVWTSYHRNDNLSYFQDCIVEAENAREAVKEMEQEHKGLACRVVIRNIRKL